PVVALDQGPLRDLGGVVKVPDLGVDRWLRDVTTLIGDRARVQSVVTAQRASLHERHRAEVVARAYEDLYLELLR
ncbi:MAG TPA: hypothetical protein VHW01_17680, partial [Polyangiaceae bacterium]|nr:hypothetical protein [Polyangiaceae bacterium]